MGLSVLIIETWYYMSVQLSTAFLQAVILRGWVIEVLQFWDPGPSCIAAAAA